MICAPGRLCGWIWLFKGDIYETCLLWQLLTFYPLTFCPLTFCPLTICPLTFCTLRFVRWRFVHWPFFRTPCRRTYQKHRHLNKCVIAHIPSKLQGTPVRAHCRQLNPFRQSSNMFSRQERHTNLNHWPMIIIFHEDEIRWFQKLSAFSRDQG